MAVFRREALVRIRNVQSDDQDGEDVEDEDAPEDVADHARESLRWVLRFSSCDGDRFRAAVCERGCHKDRCEAADATDEWRVADVPILCADVFAGAVATTVDSDTEDDEDLNMISLVIDILPTLFNSPQS